MAASDEGTGGERGIETAAASARRLETQAVWQYRRYCKYDKKVGEMQEVRLDLQGTRSPVLPRKGPPGMTEATRNPFCRRSVGGILETGAVRALGV